MTALHCFILAAERESFSRAGDEIGLTQSAVSRQIAQLEEWLGFPLFERRGRRVVLTNDGADYARAIAPALDQIRRATASFIERRPERELTIATLPSFGMRWLAPRLPKLTQKHPSLIVNFAARSETVLFTRETFDAAIHFGYPPDSNGEIAADHLFDEVCIPVLAPQWVDQKPVSTAQDLTRVPLLGLASRKEAWSEWFDDNGVKGAGIVNTATFEQFLMLAQAAVAGTGAALIPSFLIEPELASGLLVSPLEMPTRSRGAYFLVYPKRHLEQQSFALFREWIIGEAHLKPA